MIESALVLAAGNSTRIAGVARGVPKPLLPLAGKAILVRNLEWLAGQGVKSVWINLHYRPELIREVVGTGEAWGLAVRYSYEPSILGTAGAWRNLEREWSATSLVVYGDNLLRLDLHRFVGHHLRTGGLATVAVFDPSRHANTGIAGGYVELDTATRVRRFIEGARPPGAAAAYVNAGAYLLEPELRHHMGGGFQDFAKDVFPPLAEEGRLFAYLLADEDYCLGVDTPESLAVARELVRSARIVLS